MPSSEDCDDQDASAYPGAPELCDGIDNDCDDSIDEDAEDALEWWEDADGDGVGGAWEATVACEQPSGYTSTNDDCDDGDPEIYPGADEICLDGKDNDCDGAADPGCQLSGSGNLEDSDAVLHGGDPDMHLGYRLARAPDLDGAGAGLVAITRGSNGRGDLWGYAHGNLDNDTFCLEGQELGEQPYAVAVADADGDQYPELIFGTPSADTLWIEFDAADDSGCNPIDSAAVEFVGFDSAGDDLVSGFDADGDGETNILVGAPGGTNHDQETGSAFLLEAPMSGVPTTSTRKPRSG